jgi:hypothetical protein
MSNRPRLNRGETPSIFYSLFAKLFAYPKVALQPILDPAWQLRDASAKSGSKRSNRRCSRPCGTLMRSLAYRLVS